MKISALNEQELKDIVEETKLAELIEGRTYLIIADKRAIPAEHLRRLTHILSDLGHEVATVTVEDIAGIKVVALDAERPTEVRYEVKK